ncbi:MAG TPA: pitrilysin family protein [Stellaceae bacterium]|nr:pitrilysin family protein [Stellaceae bacterium]
MSVLRRGVRIAAAAAAALPLWLVPAAAERFPAEAFTLQNGMQVVVVPNHRSPAVTQMVWYKVGSADDPPGKSGIAHFLEHLMFKGTKSYPPGAFSALIAKQGGRDNAFTAADYTAFYETVAADRLPLAMRLEADRMTGLQLDDKVVLPERKVVLEERHMRVDNKPAGILDEELNARLFLHEPYRNPNIGWEDEIERLGTNDALAFYRRWYMPNNAVLVVGGDVDPTSVKTLAERWFGPTPARALPPRERASEPPHHAAVRVTMKSAHVAVPSWERLYLAPSYRMGATGEAYPLQVLAEILGGGVKSRLYKTLVLDKKLALSVGADYEPGARDLTSFEIYATPKDGVAVADLEAAIDGVLRRLLATGAAPEEVKAAEDRMLAASVYDEDSLTGPAETIGAGLTIGCTLADVEAWPERIAKVTAAEVDAAARAVLKSRNSATGVLLPERTS